jgi:hypothetical protein
MMMHRELHEFKGYIYIIEYGKEKQDAELEHQLRYREVKHIPREFGRARLSAGAQDGIPEN